MSAFSNWLTSIKSEWTDEHEHQFQLEQAEKYHQVYKATAEFLAHYGIYLSWDGEHYRITNEHTLLDTLYPDRETAYKDALLLTAQKFHELKTRRIEAQS